jgi:hypothetical protein
MKLNKSQFGNLIVVMVDFVAFLAVVTVKTILPVISVKFPWILVALTNVLLITQLVVVVLMRNVFVILIGVVILVKSLIHALNLLNNVVLG